MLSLWSLKAFKASNFSCTGMNVINVKVIYATKITEYMLRLLYLRARFSRYIASNSFSI